MNKQEIMDEIDNDTAPDMMSKEEAIQEELNNQE